MCWVEPFRGDLSILSPKPPEAIPGRTVGLSIDGDTYCESQVDRVGGKLGSAAEALGSETVGMGQPCLGPRNSLDWRTLVTRKSEDVDDVQMAPTLFSP